VNYTDYPIENISLHFSGKWTKAALLAPGAAKTPEVYAIEEGTGIDIAKLEGYAILVIE